MASIAEAAVIGVIRAAGDAADAAKLQLHSATDDTAEQQQHCNIAHYYRHTGYS